MAAASHNLLMDFIGFPFKPGTGVTELGVGWSIGTSLAPIGVVVTVAALVLARRQAQGSVPA
jgi:hypothetical protein